MINKYKIFISSVQKEFEAERAALYEYFSSDPLLQHYFTPFLFEHSAASGKSPEEHYLHEVHQCDIYLGLIGVDYGYQDADGISPTEKEYDHAKVARKERWLYLIDTTQKRHKETRRFIQKINQENTRIKFDSLKALKRSVMESSIQWLQEKGILQHTSFDGDFHREATIEDIDDQKIRQFIRTARAKRRFKLRDGSTTLAVLTHLRLINSKGQISNSGLLAFGKDPQRFFPSSFVKCAHFHGRKVQKPVPDYKTFEGDVFKMIDNAYDFVLSKLASAIVPVSGQTDTDVHYEIPPDAIREAIVNALAHRDYLSKGSVQVMVFSDRLEVSNPGGLSAPLSLELLQTQHGSYPVNPLLVECLYLTGDIERLGTGISDIIELCAQASLGPPEFSLDEGFKITVLRPQSASVKEESAVEKSGHHGSTMQVPWKHHASTMEVSIELVKVILATDSEMKRSEIQEKLQLKNTDHFRRNYILPALRDGIIELALPDHPRHPKQKYRLTEKGRSLRKKLMSGN